MKHKIICNDRLYYEVARLGTMRILGLKVALYNSKTKN